VKRVVVTRPVDPAAVALLSGRTDVRVLPAEPPIPGEAELVQAAADADILFTMPGHPITAAVFNAAPRLELVASLGAGYDNIDLEAARARRIPVTHAPGVLDETTADLAFALLLATARRVPQAERTLRAGAFRGWSVGDAWGLDVHGRTLGIVGLGRIGAAVARRAAGFSMRILYTGPRRHEATEASVGAQFVPLDELLSASDFISLHAPLTPRTRHLMDAKAFARMKPTAVLLNTARGALVDEQALIEALGSGRPAAAGLDVFEREPHVPVALLELPNVVLTPHIGSATLATRRAMAVRAAENILAHLEGLPLPNLVPELDVKQSLGKTTRDAAQHR
jgi:glyoxylate reductase